MKPLPILLAALIGISTFASVAQEDKRSSVPVMQRISVGGYAGITNTMANPSGFPVGLQNDVHALNVGAFGRLFTGEHFAMQADLFGRFPEKEFTTIPYGSPLDSTRLFMQHRDVRSRAMGWLLQVQYF